MTKSIRTGWNFDNSYARLPNSFYQCIEPTAVQEPELVILNTPLAESLGLDAEQLNSKEGAEIFVGNSIPEGAAPLAQAYAGHQFGHLTMLGDGRAVLYGEQLTPSGERADIQLKGSGRTRFSRGGDGRATLGPMLREYIISEAMHALGIPTTRSLAVAKTGENVVREALLPGAVLTRTAASHLRVGTFQYAASLPIEERRLLADYAIKRHYPDLETKEDRYLSLFQEVIKRQASLIAKWQLVGFIHGVMNTDNMTISGETIDYGPCAFMDVYDPATVFSSIDEQGRYAYQNQPAIGQWNLARFAETLLPFFHEKQEVAVEMAQKELETYGELYHRYWLNGMRSKIGLINEEQDDKSLIEDLLRLMKASGADFTNTFRALTLAKTEETELNKVDEFSHWYKKWQERLARQEESKEDVYEIMKRSNPAVIPRNHRVEEALEAAVKNEDYSVVNRLLAVLANPYAHSSEQDEYAKLPEPSSLPYRTYCGT
ncbi:protein adenylyltransferase SelO [Bacillus piscicola]|uniref:protein adenylyltransferase SelO n=1 Tax=Bacillus piscicola TaxID=1632684 RepID=UPI001F09CA30|nr:YdiU family protein [Bacillus piscicola]